MPLKPPDLIELWVHLDHDTDDEVNDAAEASLKAFSAEEFLTILQDKETPAAVLAWAVFHRDESDLRGAALQNTSLPDEAVEAVAGELPQELAELVVINHTRLLRRTSLLETLETNPHLNNDQRRRLRELRESHKVGHLDNLSEDVLREIGNHSEWTKSYSVACGLVRNPRTPVEVALNLLSRLSDSDLRSVSTNRDVPGPIRTAALQRLRRAGN
jgi:hypothetical protein